MKKQRETLFDRNLRRLAGMMKPISKALAAGALLDIGAVLCAAAAPDILGELVDRLYAYGRSGSGEPILNQLLPGLGILLALYAGYALLSYGNMRLMNQTVSRYFTCNLRIAISDKIQRLPVRYVDQAPVGDILERMTDDVSQLGGSVHDVFDTVVKGVFQIAVICLAMFLENWALALVVAVLMPASVWLSATIAGKSETAFSEEHARYGEMTELVEESFSNYSTMKAYNLEEYTENRHAEGNEKLRAASVRANFMGNLVQPIIKFTNMLTYIGLCLLGGWLVVQGRASVGVVVTVILYARQFAGPLEQIAGSLGRLSRVKAAAGRVFELLDLEEEPVSDGRLAGPLQGQVTFENVSFSYDPAQPLMESLNLSVKPGQKVAIVGPTGAGKTTIVNLLMRFYDPDGGAIFLDGQDTRCLSRDEVRNCFGMVLQDTWLFRGTIADNVAFGKPGATREEIEQACRRAYCHRFICTLPEGYNTVVGDDMTNLSGGQKQLLTIARALLADRPLLILDEATSNVDTRTEILIQKAMDRLMKGRTCFVIAHRLSTIVDADVILVLNHGAIVEQGTHRQLLERQGFYYRMYNSQYAV